MSKLEDYRQKVDEVDEKIIKDLAERMRLVKLIGEYKKRNEINPLDETRWDEVIESRLKEASDNNVDQTMVKDIFDRIHKYALKIEKDT